MTKSADAPLLEMRGISKSFHGVRALDDVSISVRAGTVHALMGENGAGKSTLMKCLFGVYTADAGRIFLEGREVRFRSSKEALNEGVAMVHQELNQALSLSAAENLWLGRFPRLHRALPFTSDARAVQMTKAIFDEFEIDTDPEAKMSTLSVSRRQMVEIAKAVSYNSRIIAFDEPTSSLSDAEAKKLFAIIEKLKARGCGIIYISHKMEEILKLSDDVTVMRDGRLIATRPARELTTNELIRLMVGRELDDRYPERRRSPAEELLRAEGLTGVHSILKGASFKLTCGEVLGIAGLEGSGRSELAEALFGLSEKRGSIRLLGREIRNGSPREAMANGFALITEERRKTGIFAGLSITANTVIASLKRYARFGIVSRRATEAATDESIRALRIKARSRAAKMEELSGGNQQKVILARWLLTEPKLLILDEPTRGIDVGAKYEIYKLIGELAERGTGIILISSEMPELLGLSDRILVMSGGRIAGELTAREATQERIMELAARFA